MSVGYARRYKKDTNRGKKNATKILHTIIGQTLLSRKDYSKDVNLAYVEK